MSHFTVLCLLKEDQDLAELLAPFSENLECEPRIYCTREVFLENRNYYKDDPVISKMTDDEFIEEMRNHAYLLDADGNELTTYNKDVFEYVVCPGTSDKYNPSICGIGDLNSTRNKVDIPPLNEILPYMRADTPLEGLSQCDEKSRQALLLLQDLYEEKEREQDSRNEKKVALDTEVQYNSRRVQQDAEISERGMCNMQEETWEDVLSSGSRPQDPESTRSFVRKLQHSLGTDGGQLSLARCNESIPHFPHVIKKFQIRGAKWDWWSVGGRWSDQLRLTAEAYETYTADADSEEDIVLSSSGSKPGKCNAAKVKYLDFPPDPEVHAKSLRFWDLFVSKMLKPETEQDEEVIKWARYKPEFYLERFGTRENYAQLESNFGTWAVLTPDGVWHEKGNMGWFAMSDETHDEAAEWARSYKEKFIDTADPDWIAVVVDCHI